MTESIGFYYKGRQQGKSPAQTQLGLAVADKPEGPYIKHPKSPVIPGNHEVLVWPEGKGVAALIGNSGAEGVGEVPDLFGGWH